MEIDILLWESIGVHWARQGETINDSLLDGIGSFKELIDLSRCSEPAFPRVKRQGVELGRE